MTRVFERSLCGRFQDLLCLVLLTLCIIFIRLFFERCCFTPLGRWFNLVEIKKKSVAHNAVLHPVYNELNQCKNLSIAKKLNMSERQVERWWRLRRSQDKPSTLVKFTENMWMGSFYLWNFIFGIFVLWDKQWFWDLDLIIEETEDSAPSDVWWYYMISSAFYWSLTITQFWDVRRKDFWQMFVHHIATIALLMLSWIVNVYRILVGLIVLFLYDAADLFLQYGKAVKRARLLAFSASYTAFVVVWLLTRLVVILFLTEQSSIVLVLHDAADLFLQFGKAAKRARLPAVSATYTAFVVVWLLTRLVLYPCCVLTRTTTRTLELNKLSHHILNAMLWFVFLLNVMWTWDLCRVVYKALRSGQEPKDVRSSSSDSEVEDSKDKTK